MANKNTKAAAPKFETLVADVDSAQTSLNSAKEKLNAALTEVANGHVVNIAGLPHEVREVKGKKELKCMLTKRQIAAVRGEPIPEIKSRNRRTAAEIAAETAEAAE